MSFSTFKYIFILFLLKCQLLDNKSKKINSAEYNEEKGIKYMNMIQ